MSTPPEISKRLDDWRRQAHAEGVLHQENVPFFLPATEQTRSAVLLVHGFTASPWEMLRPAEYLSARGHACLAVRLPGHGTDPEDLRGRRWQEWLAAVCEAAELLSRSFDRVDAAGSSTGALLLLRAATETTLRRLVLFSPYLRVQHRLAPLAGLLKHIKPFQHTPRQVEVSSYFYNRRPLAGVEQINLLCTELRSRLNAVQQPCLVLCSRGDQTIDPDSAQELYQLLGSEKKEFHRYGNDVPHVLTIDENPQLDDSLERMGRFLDGEG